jgi:PAS domain S-box-containing protein
VNEFLEVGTSTVRTLERAKRQWESAVDSMPQILCLLDRDGRVIRANRSVERWRRGIDIEDVGGLYLHQMLHRDCVDSRCYLRRFGERAALALARGRRANCDAWDPILKRHLLIRARKPIVARQENDSLNEVFAVVTIDDVSKTRASEKVSEELTLALNRRVLRERGKRTQAEQVHGRIIEALDNTPGLFAMADAGGVLYYLNPAGRALLGLASDEETCGMSLLECHAPGVRVQLMKTVMPAAARAGSWSGDSVLLARDGSEIRTTLVIIAHYGIDGKLAGFSVQERDMSEWVKAEEALCASQVELRRLATQHLTIQENERRRIAADLHDSLGQSLTLLKHGIQEALRQMGAGVPRKAVESVKQLIPKVAGAMDELHRVSIDLRPSSLDILGILPTLSWFVREFELANPKTRIEKHISVSEKDVPEPLKIAIFRILQEAVNNAVKHAGADCIRISLHHGGGVLAFSIEDDGKGFDPGGLARQGDARKGLGMQSMRERAELSGGSYAVSSAPGQGTKVCVGWPAEQAPTARYAGFGASAIARDIFPIQENHKNPAKTRNESVVPDEHALKPGGKGAYRALRDTLMLEETDVA